MNLKGTSLNPMNLEIHQKFDIVQRCVVVVVTLVSSFLRLPVLSPDFVIFFCKIWSLNRGRDYVTCAERRKCGAVFRVHRPFGSDRSREMGNSGQCKPSPHKRHWVRCASNWKFSLASPNSVLGWVMVNCIWPDASSPHSPPLRFVSLWTLHCYAFLLPLSKCLLFVFFLFLDRRVNFAQSITLDVICRAIIIIPSLV